MASPEVEQYSELGFAHLCDRCHVLEDFEFLRTQVDDRQHGNRQKWSSPDWYRRLNFKIVTWKNLKTDQMALSGCEFCKLILSELSLETSNSRWQPCPTGIHVDIRGMAISGRECCEANLSTDNWVIQSFTITLTTPEGGLYHEFEVLIGSDEGEIIKPPLIVGLELSLEITKNLPSNIIEQYPSIFTSLPSKQMTRKNINFLERSLKLCTSSCHPLRRVERPPTRLLDLDSVTESRSGCLRLIQTEDMPEAEVPNLKYAALSYFRGNAIVAATQSRTTLGNLKERTKCISLKEMSTVTKDAIELCKKLQIRYLWIDALCILQGEEDQARADWEHASQFMDTIYAQAYFTICAASSPNCQVGFLHGATRPKLRLGLRPELSDQFESSYLVMPSNFRADNLTSDWDRHIWNTRAWTFQERLLSERLIIFGIHMIHFTCSRLYSIESVSTDTCCINNGNDSGINFPSKVSQPISDEVRAQFFEMSRKTLYHFAAADLTRDRDRLPALAGIARRVHELTGSKYYAGCWEDNFHRDLLFRIYDPPLSTVTNPRDLSSDQYFGPSWSFVSRNNGKPVSLGYWWGSSEPQYDGIQASTTLQGKNEFGEVNWGLLRVRTKVLLTSINLEMEEKTLEWGGKGVWIGEGQVHFDGHDLKAQCACVSNPHGDDMAWALISARSASAKYRFLGLLLRSTGRPREYYRIGCFEWPTYGDLNSYGPDSWDTENIEII